MTRGRGAGRPWWSVALAIVCVVVLVPASAIARSASPPGRPLPAASWTRSLPHEPWGLAADASGVVATTDLGDVLALAADGRVQWSTKVDGIRSGNPAIDATFVLVVTKSEVVVLDRADGTRRGGLTSTDPVEVALVAGTAFVSEADGALGAVDVATGRARWTVRYPGAVVVPPRVDTATGIVLASWHQGPQPMARALDVRSGALRWETPIGRYTAAPALTGDLGFVAEGDGSFHAQVRALALVSGAPRWQTALPGSFESAIEPSVVDGQLVVADHFGTVTLLDASSGKIRWQANLDLPVLDTRLVVTGGGVALVTASRHLVVLDRATGRVVAKGRPGGRFGVPFAIAGLGSPRPTAVVVVLRRTDPPRVEARPAG